MTINAVKLRDELIVAGLNVDGVSDITTSYPDPPPEWYTFTGPSSEVVRVDFVGTPSSGDLTTAQAVIGAHDPTDYVQQVKDDSDAQAAAIPEWANWDEAAALAWHDANLQDPIDLIPEDITGLSDANFRAAVQQMLGVERKLVQFANAQTRLDVAQRNKLWPWLQE